MWLQQPIICPFCGVFLSKGLVFHLLILLGSLLGLLGSRLVRIDGEHRQLNAAQDKQQQILELKE